MSKIHGISRTFTKSEPRIHKLDRGLEISLKVDQLELWIDPPWNASAENHTESWILNAFGMPYAKDWLQHHTKQQLLIVHWTIFHIMKIEVFKSSISAKKTLFSLDFASHSCPSGCAPQLAGRWSSSAAERSAGVRAPSPKRNCRARSAALAKSCGASEASAEMLLFVARAQTKTSADWLWEILEVLPHSHKCYAASRHQVQPILRIDHHERWFRHCGLLKICLERCNVHVHKQKVAWI